MPLSTLKDLDKLAWGWTEYTDPKFISYDHIFTSYRLKNNVCKNKTCRRNCRGNPYCLSGLGENRILESIKNPQDDSTNNLPKRAPGNFVGLKNLGATCYVNSLLQLWFHNKTFRDALFLWNPLEDPNENSNSSLDLNRPFTPQTVIGHLQQLFALMYHSKCRYIDPSPLVQSLRLDTSTQQDAQEFSKLFISLLESSLSHQTLPQVRNLIADTFRGEYMYVTRCCKCLTESVSPSMFYELELNVKGHHTLTECLAEFLQEEKLEGVDCYSCTTCQTKQEACRYIKLCSLPPILNLQLLRFVYDREKGQRKKLKSVVQFPEILDMKDFVESNSDTSLIYNLSAVLIHKGARASSGHFVAYIKDMTTGTWNTFNDETVENLEGKKLKLYEIDSENGCKTKVPRLPKGFQSSTDAYMLVYTWENHNPNLTEVQLPKMLQEYVDSQNKIFEDFCQEIADSKKEDVERQEQLLNLYNRLSVDGVDDLDEIDVLPVDWLISWLDNKREVTHQIDNTKLLCRHDRLDPTAVTSAKYVSRDSADVLFDQFGGGPRLTGGDILCKPCVTNTCLITRTRAKTLEESKEITNLLKKRMGVDEPGFYVSKYCLRTWRTRVLNQLEGKSCSMSAKSDGTDKCFSETKTDHVLPHTSSACKNVVEDKINHKCTLTRRRSLVVNKVTNPIQKRKHASAVSVPLSEIRDCIVLCQRLQFSLNNSTDLKQFSKKAVLERCKQLKVKLKKLVISPRSNKSKTFNSRRFLGMDMENQKCNGVENTNSETKHENNCQNSRNVIIKEESEEIVNSDAYVDRNEENTSNQIKHNKREKEAGNSENCLPCDNGDNKVQLKTDDEGDNNLDDGIESSKEFNEAIKCPHGNLLFDETERKLVPIRVWEILKQYFPFAPEFAHDSVPCHQCQNLATKDEVVKQQYYETAVNQKKILSDLFHLRNRPQIGKSDSPLYIIPKEHFYQPWSAFLKAAGRKDGPNLVEPPSSLRMDSLLCAHGLLHYSPQFEGDQARIVLVTNQEWDALLTMYIAECEVTVASNFTTSPELCESCFAARIESEEKEKLNYERAKLKIRMVPSTFAQDDQDCQENGAARKRPRLADGSTSPIPPELKKAMKSVAGIPGGDVRRSSRNRKVPGQKDVSFVVSSNLTMRELKQKITSQLAVAPFDQHLYTEEGKELVGDFNTLSSLGILPNSTLLLQVDEPKESFDDMMEECSAPNEPELGFKGTGLLHAY